MGQIGISVIKKGMKKLIYASLSKVMWNMQCFMIFLKYKFIRISVITKNVLIKIFDSGKVQEYLSVLTRNKFEHNRNINLENI